MAVGDSPAPEGFLQAARFLPRGCDLFVNITPIFPMDAEVRVCAKKATYLLAFLDR